MSVCVGVWGVGEGHNICDIYFYELSRPIQNQLLLEPFFVKS